MGAAEGEGGCDGDGGGDDGRGGGEGSIPLFWQKEIVRLIFSFIIIFRQYSKFMWRSSQVKSSQVKSSQVKSI